MAPTISVVINTLNEEANLPLALRSVRSWVDEIVVVDMHSADNTVKIAREFGAKVFFHEPVGFADPARAFALDHARGDWILILDADEIIPCPLSSLLLRLANTEDADVVSIPRLNYLLGVPLMHTRWGPDEDAQFRFFRKGCLRTTGEVHNYLHPLPDSRILKLRFKPGLAIVHFNYLDCEQFIEKLNRYTSIHAKQAHERGERISPLGALARGAAEFGLRYLKGGGWRDGWRGFYLSIFMSFYRLATAAKLQELAGRGSRELIEARYREEAEKILAIYPASLLRVVADDTNS